MRTLILHPQMRRTVVARSGSSLMSRFATAPTRRQRQGVVSLFLPSLCLLALALLPATTVLVHAKISSGSAHLSGISTEATLIKFAVSPHSVANITLSLTSYGMYEDEQSLRFHVYADDEWRAVKREPLCAEKVKYARNSVPVVFLYRGMRPNDRKGKGTEAVEMYEARIRTEVPNVDPENQAGRSGKGAGGSRSRYLYFVIDDCSLERYNHDAKMPDMRYTINVMNGRPVKKNGGSEGNDEVTYEYDHLPADEEGIDLQLKFSFLLSAALAAVLFWKVARTLGGGEVHVAIVIVVAACGCNALSSLCELIHLGRYRTDGLGIYSIDALSSHFEAISDSMVALVLLSVGGGWTLPADVVGRGLRDDGGGAIGNFRNVLLCGVRNPAGSLLDLISSGGESGDKKGGIVCILIVLVHTALAQWGRTFDDDFDTYHGLEHPPGRALMALRFVLGLVFVTNVGAVRSGGRGRCPPSLTFFLTKFGLVGLSYFASLPGVSMFVASALPYHRRHQALHWGAALVQACSLISLTWLFAGGADASAYHRLSRTSRRAATEGDLTGDLSMAGAIGGGVSRRPTAWRFGKTKIRLD